MIIRTNEMQVTLDKLYNLLSTEKKVYYARFGDGDTYIMSGAGRCIEHTASPELQQELLNAFTIDDPNFIKGVMITEPIFNGSPELIQQDPASSQNARNLVEKLYADKQEEIVFDSHTVLMYIAVYHPEIMTDFLDRFIRPKKKLFIGCVDKDKIERLVGKIDYYVNIPRERVSQEKADAGIPVGAYYAIDEWWPKVMDCIDDVELVLPTAGMAGRVTCGRLWKLDKKVHCIELGSIVDDAVGICSRTTWHPTKAGGTIQKLLMDI